MRLLGRLCTGLLAGVLLAAPAVALEPNKSDQATLSRLSNEWMIAIERKDRATLDRIVASDFVLQMPGDEQGRIIRRNEWMANAIAQDWSEFRYENVVVSVHGDQAIVTSRLNFKVAPFPLALDSGVVDIWRIRDGRWQVTKRYLGESRIQQRIAFFAGILAAIVAGLLAYGVARLVRRRRRTLAR